MTRPGSSGPSADPGDDEAAVAPHLQRCRLGRQRGGPTDGQCVAPGREAGRLPGGIDAAHLHRQGGETGGAQHHNDHQGRNSQGGLNRAEPTASAVTDYPRVLKARPMMLVSAPTIESPVTTL